MGLKDKKQAVNLAQIEVIKELVATNNVTVKKLDISEYPASGYMLAYIWLSVPMKPEQTTNKHKGE